MAELQPYRPARVEWEEQILSGRRDAVEAELQRLDRAGQLVSRAGAVVESRGVISVKIRRRVEIAGESLPGPRRGHHPGWYIGILLSATALVGVCGWMVLAIVSAAAAIGTLVLGVLVVAGAVVVLPKMLSGDRFTQIMNIRR